MRNQTWIILRLAAVAMAASAFAVSASAATLTWDITPGTVGAGNGTIEVGPGTWNTTNGNWTSDGGANNVAWNNATPDSAVFTGAANAAYTVTVSGSINTQDLNFNTTGNSGARYTIDGGTLNFAPGGTIRNNINRYNQTITSTITGSPAVETRDFNVGNQYNGLVFAPSSGTQTLGAVLNPNNTGNTDKAGIFLAGSTSGNTVASIAYAGGDRYGRVVKQDSSTWTVGNVSTGFVDVNGGTLVGTGQLGAYYQEVRVNSGGTLSGDATIFTNDRRGSPHVKSGGTIAPGSGVGTITVDYGTSGGSPTPSLSDYSFTLRTGSAYEWEVGPSDFDTVHITEGGLFLQDFTLKIFDAGGTPDVADQLPVFTYEPGVVVDMAGFPNLASNFDTSALGGSWTVGSLALTDDGEGAIHLTGLSNVAAAPPAPVVPEPATFLIAALGLLGMSLLGWRRRKRG